MKKIWIAAAAVGGVIALASAAPTQAANLLTNGSFETGDFTGWTPEWRHQLYESRNDL